MSGLDEVKSEWDFAAATQTIDSTPTYSGMSVSTTLDATSSQFVSETDLAINSSFAGASYDTYVDFTDTAANSFAAESTSQELVTSVTPTKIMLTSPTSSLTTDTSQTVIYVALTDNNGNIDTRGMCNNITQCLIAHFALRNIITNHTLDTNVISYSSTKSVVFTAGEPAKVVLSNPGTLGTKKLGYMNIQVQDTYGNSVLNHSRFDIDVTSSSNNTTLANSTVAITGGRGDFNISNTMPETVTLSMQLNANYSLSIDTSQTRNVAFISPSISYASAGFSEASANDGSIAAGMDIDLANGLFVGYGYEDFIASGKATITNLPAGLTASLRMVTTTKLLFESQCGFNDPETSFYRQFIYFILQRFGDSFSSPFGQYM